MYSSIFASIIEICDYEWAHSGAAQDPSRAVRDRLHLSAGRRWHGGLRQQVQLPWVITVSPFFSRLNSPLYWWRFMLNLTLFRGPGQTERSADWWRAQRKGKCHHPEDQRSKIINIFQIGSSFVMIVVAMVFALGNIIVNKLFIYLFF